MKQDFDHFRQTQRRRMSDVSQHEKRVYSMVSSQCLNSELKVDHTQEEMRAVAAKFDVAIKQIEEANQKMLNRYKEEIIDLKKKLFAKAEETVV